MAMSGVKLDDACKLKYEEVQKKHMHRYVTFHIKDDKEIVVDKVISVILFLKWHTIIVRLVKFTWETLNAILHV